MGPKRLELSCHTNSRQQFLANGAEQQRSLLANEPAKFYDGRSLRGVGPSVSERPNARIDDHVHRRSRSAL